MSITLATPKVLQLNNEVIENDTDGADMNSNIDFFSNVLTFTLREGTLITDDEGNVNLNAGQYADALTVTLNLTTGEWSSSNGLTGVLALLQGQSGKAGPPASLTNLQKVVTNLRNMVEQFSVDNNIMPGTQVPW